MIRSDIAGPSKQHGPGCSLADVDDCRPRNDEELKTVREGRYGR